MAEKHRALRQLALGLGAGLLFGGCQTSRNSLPPSIPAPGTSVPVAPTPAATSAALPPHTPAVPPAPPRENHLSPASQSLVTQARTLISRGDLDSASATLDRALRIEPSNPLVWIELGRLRLAERDLHQAEGCARKALLLAGGDRGAQALAGRLLADTLRAQQRNPEAAEIERQPYMH